MESGWGKADVAREGTWDRAALAVLHSQPGWVHRSPLFFVCTSQILNEYSFV